METMEHRLERFQNGPPIEIIDTLLNSLHSFFNNEIRLTTENGNFQTSLLFMGIHAVALTISEGLFDKKGPDGYKLFLEKFIDGNKQDTKFSSISELIHDWRNNLAHQWIGSIGHSIAYDYKMNFGWEKKDGITYINPRIYCEQYLGAFGSGGRIYDYRKMLTAAELEEAKQRLIEKYIKN